MIDVDGHNFPNLALMKLAAWHKARGDIVEWWSGFVHYDRVYMSKVFTFSYDFETVIDADEVVRGGTGYKIYDDLPPEIEATKPDYTIYPDFKQAVGFLTRGCIRSCPWCVVPRKEGKIRAAASWRDIKRPDSNEILFLDNNVLAHEWGLSQIEDMGGQPVKVDFNQGLDARLIDHNVAALLSRLKWIKFCRMSCDTSAMLPVVEQASAYLQEVGIKASCLWCYVLVTDVEEAERRVMALDAMGITTFAQPYRDYCGGEPTKRQKEFARWVNNKAVFRSCKWADYKKNKKGAEHENHFAERGGLDTD